VGGYFGNTGVDGSIGDLEKYDEMVRAGFNLIKAGGGGYNNGILRKM
jgi:hypothetical protein